MNIALILSGGAGLSLGRGMPKQYVLAEGKMVITHCLQTIAEHSKIDAIEIIAEDQWRERIYKQMPDAVLRKFSGFAKPGANRQQSILSGMKVMMPSVTKSDIIMVHDAIRPLISKPLISACLKACEKHDGGVCMVPMHDAVYLGKKGCIATRLERGRAYLEQTPAAFRLGKYYEANRKLAPDVLDQVRDVSEPAIIAGMDLALIPGDENNFSIMMPLDLERFKMILKEH